MKSFKFYGAIVTMLVASALPCAAYAEGFSAYCGATTSQLPLTKNTPVSIGILDELADDQEQEAFEVVFEAATKTANVSVSQSKKSQTVTFTFPKEGQYKYKIYGYLLFKNEATEGLSGRRLVSEGFGKIDIREGGTYSFYSALEDPEDKRIRACIQEYEEVADSE
jgi:hypothetical protein